MHPGSWIQSSLGDLLSGFRYVSSGRIVKHASTNRKVRCSRLVLAPRRLLQSSGFTPVRGVWFHSTLQLLLSNESVFADVRRRQFAAHSRIHHQSLKSAIFGDQEHIPSRLTRWHQLCPLCCSSKPRKSHQYPCSCAPKLRSSCSRCGRTYQRSRWPGACRRG